MSNVDDGRPMQPESYFREACLRMRKNLAKAATMAVSFFATFPLLQSCGVSLPILGDFVLVRGDGEDDLEDDLEDLLDDLFD